MQGADTFSSFHPLVSLLYYALIIISSMFFMHPACLAISLCGALAYLISINGQKALPFNAVYIVPMVVAAVLVNPLFNHQGVTILAYYGNGNPLTLESAIYGLAAAAMMAAVICWFGSFNRVMTADKLVYLFGRLAPAVSLVLSMSLRLIPRYIAQVKIISDAQKCIGRDSAGGGPVTRARRGMAVISILTTWAFENAIETADSMKSRGYGLPGRTAFSIYRFDRRDAAALLYLLFTGVYIFIGSLAGGLYFRYFPTVRGAPATPYTVSLFAAYALLCLSPLAINAIEGYRWKALRSRI